MGGKPLSVDQEQVPDAVDGDTIMGTRDRCYCISLLARPRILGPWQRILEF